jgi:hypothetical protein
MVLLRHAKHYGSLHVRHIKKSKTQNVGCCSADVLPSVHIIPHLIIVSLVIALRGLYMRNKDLRFEMLKGPKFREPCSFTWQHNSMSILNCVEEYTRR